MPDHKRPTSSVQAAPDVNKTPAAPSPVPIPYPSIASGAGNGAMMDKVKLAKKPTITDKTELGSSKGDEAGTMKSVLSKQNMDKPKPKPSTSKVKSEGAKLTPTLDAMGGAHAAPPGSSVAPSQTKVLLGN